MPGRRTRRPDPRGPRFLGGYVPRSCGARSSAASRRRATTDFALAVLSAACRHLEEPAEGHRCTAVACARIQILDIKASADEPSTAHRAARKVKLTRTS